MSSAAATPARPSLFSRLHAFEEFFFHPVDGSYLGFFRFLFGLILIGEIHEFYRDGWIQTFYVRAPMLTTYDLFPNLTALSAQGMESLFGILLLATFGITLGLFPRISSGIFFFGFGYSFLLQKARYLNHYYLVLLLAFLFMFLPSDRCFSVRSWFRTLNRETPPKPRTPGIYPGQEAEAELLEVDPERSVPMGAYLILRAQIGLVYLFAAVAKLHPDWMLGVTTSRMLWPHADLPWVGAYAHTEAAALFVAWGGILIDGFAFPLLSWGRTRGLMLFFLTCFHLSNSYLFNIGIFPWMMLATSFLFLDPDRWRVHRDRVLAPLGRLFPVAAWVNGARERRRLGVRPAPFSGQRSLAGRLAYGGFWAWVLVQCLIPLRALTFENPPEFTDVGHRFSWRMKLRARHGNAVVVALDKNTLKTYLILPQKFLPFWLSRKIQKDPDQLRQFCVYMKRILGEDGLFNVDLRVVALMSLNGREPQHLVDPMVDFTQVERVRFGMAPWIQKLSQPRKKIGEPFRSPWDILRSYPYPTLFRNYPEKTYLAIRQHPESFRIYQRPRMGRFRGSHFP